MINIITMDELIEEKFIYDNEYFFFKYVIVADVPGYEGILKAIDGASLLDKNSGLISTSIGLTDVNHLSTGCKTALNIAYVLQNPDLGYKTVNVTECGYNALDVIFDMELKDLKLLLKHRDGVCKCKEHDYVVNGKYMKDLAYMRA